MTTAASTGVTARGPGVSMTAPAPALGARPPRTSPATLLRGALTAIFVLLLALFILGPLGWLAIQAFLRSPSHFPALIPSDWSMQWWHTVFDDSSLSGAITASFIFAPTVTAVSAVICLPAAYAFSRYIFPGRRVFLIAIFAVNAFPKFGLFVALAGLFYTLNLMNSFTGVVIVQLLGTIVFMTWIPSAAFASVPRSLEEAARDAGAGPFTVFARVTLPLAAPGILVAVILSFLAAFDEAQGTFLVGVPTYVTMPTEMYNLVGSYPPGTAAVFSILLTVPSMILMLLVRKHVMGGYLAEGFQLR